MKQDTHIFSLLLVVTFGLGVALISSGCASSQSARTGDTAEQSADAEEIEVGYGTQKRSNSASAISTIDAEEVRRGRATRDLTDLLEGNVAGVVVNRTAGGIQVRIRGNSSILGSNEPLYVIDGVPIEVGPNGLIHAVNPYDVKSITVLKDAAATSIYGARGGNGVIIIKTRSQ